jgi:short-subunit dehydrogenase
MIFQNKNILITGASSGLGLCLTEHFNKKNANLICVGRSKLKIKKILRDLDNTKIDFLSLDLTKDKNLKKLLGFVKKEKKKN